MHETNVTYLLRFILFTTKKSRKDCKNNFLADQLIRKAEAKAAPPENEPVIP